MNQTNKNDAPLYIDVYCYKCKKRMALSNAIQHGDGMSPDDF